MKARRPRPRAQALASDEFPAPRSEKVTGGIPRMRIAGEGLSPAAPPPASGCGHGFPPEGSPPRRHLGEGLCGPAISAPAQSASALPHLRPEPRARRGSRRLPIVSLVVSLVPETSAFRHDLGFEPSTVGLTVQCSTIELVVEKLKGLEPLTSGSPEVRP